MLIEKILYFIENKDMTGLKDLLSDSEDMEILHIFNELSAEEQVIVFRLLKKDNALHIFEQLDTDLQQNLLRSFSDARTIEFVNELAPDDRVRLLDELPASVAKKLINALSPAERESTNILMGYESGTAGRTMTTEYISLTRSMSVSQAMDKVRRLAREMETVYTLYVTDSAKKLEGVLSLKELVIANSDDKIEDIMSKKAIYVFTDTSQEEAARVLQELDLIALPVVDREERLVGIVTVDDAIDILEEEVTDEIFDQAGLVARKEANRSEVLIRGNLWKIWKVRLPFLFITIVAGMLAAVVMEGFEEVLESIVAVAFFIPLIMDLGGTIGTQSSTVFARGVALGHINTNGFLKHFLKEVGIGFSIGLVSGLIAGTVSAVMSVVFWEGTPMIGVAVGLAVVATMTLATLLGFLVPFLLLKLNVDQAAGSAPIITSIKDISGLLIYFTVVSVLFRYLV